MQKALIIFGSVIDFDSTAKLFKTYNNINSKICCKMSKKHDENKDIRLISRIAKVDYSNKTIQTSRTTPIGIRTWGRIDFLVNHCGWFFSYNNDVIMRTVANNSNYDATVKRKREAKKAAKEQTLTNKKKR